MPPTNQHMLETTLDGGFIGGAGNMFDIHAKTDLAITNFAVHSYAATTVTIEIWKKKTPGSCVGVQSNPAEWELIGTVTFGSQSATIPSVLPSGSFPRVLVKKGDVQSFYVTFQDITNYNRYSGGSTLGAIFKQNDDLEILEGYAKQYNFGSDYYPRVWNGQVFYEVGTFTEAPAAPTTPLTPVPATEAPVTPTAPPTPLPTTGKPVAATIPPTLVPISLAPSKIRIQSPTSTLQSTTNLTSRALQTTFAGGNGQAGNMFDITTNKAIVIKALDIHTYSTSSVRVLVYTKQGSHEGFEKDPSVWTLICDTRVYGAGSPQPTHIPAESVAAVSVLAGDTQAFYVTLNESKIRYTNGLVAADDGTVTIVKSSGNKYPFGDSYRQRIWNGVLYYGVVGRDSMVLPPTPTPNTQKKRNQNLPSKKYVTTFANKNGSYGSMFHIKAKEDLIIHNLAIHTYHQFGTLVEVEVYKLKAKNTSWQGKEGNADEWDLVGSAQVEGSGTGNPTQLPPNTIQEILVSKGDTQALYVTIIGGGLRYTNGKSTSSVLLPFSESADLIVYEGGGVGAPRFGGTFPGRVFNGILEYYTPNASSISSASATDSVTVADVAIASFDAAGSKKEEG
jgi:hypothetical protein